MYNVLQDANILRPLNLGFMPHRGYQHLSTILQVLMEEAKSRNRDQYLLFVDFQKAYASIPLWVIVDTLRWYGVNDEVIFFIQAVAKGIYGQVIYIKHTVTTVGFSGRGNCRQQQ